MNISKARGVPEAGIAGPTSKDWERVQPLIRQLYVDEDKTLKEVMGILARDHGHKATPKMFKDRLKKWNLEKNNRELDMVHILHKKTRRDAAGKRSAFQVRGRDVNFEDVLHYFRRKRLEPASAMSGECPPTPPGISCRTPSPVNMFDHLDSDGHTTSQSLEDMMQDFSTSMASTSQTNTGLHTRDMYSGYSGVLTPVPEDKTLQHLATDHTKRLIFDSANIPRAPLPPQTLLISEQLFNNITIYFNGSIANGTWGYENGSFSNINADVDSWNYPVYFVYNMSLAIDLIEQGAFVEARRLMSKTFYLVRDLLKAQHPETLRMFLRVFLDLKCQGLQEVVVQLQDYISQMASYVIPKEHPWSQVCQLVGRFTADDLEIGLVKCWECANAVLKKNLGPFSDPFLDSYLEYLRTSLVRKSANTESILLRLYLQIEKEFGRYDDRCLTIQYSLGHFMLSQGRGEDAVTRTKATSFPRTIFVEYQDISYSRATKLMVDEKLDTFYTHPDFVVLQGILAACLYTYW